MTKTIEAPGKVWAFMQAMQQGGSPSSMSPAALAVWLASGARPDLTAAIAQAELPEARLPEDNLARMRRIVAEDERERQFERAHGCRSGLAAGKAQR